MQIKYRLYHPHHHYPKPSANQHTNKEHYRLDNLMQMLRLYQLVLLKRLILNFLQQIYILLQHYLIELIHLQLNLYLLI